MEGLDLLKQEWNKQDATLPKYKSTDFYQMILKKSSSMVKWIFYISIIEFVFWTILNIFFAFKDDKQDMEALGLTTFNTINYILSYAILIYFMVRFYMNYKRINSDDSVKGLMTNILNTRQTVKHYVWFNILFFTVGFIIVSIIMYNNGGFNLPTEVSPIMLIGILSVTLIVIIGILLLFYRLIYGILTRRLKRNYNELKKMEV